MNVRRAERDDFRTAELCAEAAIHAKDEVVYLRATTPDGECGLVVLDLDSCDDDEAKLVALLVVAVCRGQGLGTDLLTHAENYARSIGRRRMSLIAEPLIDDLDDGGSVKEALIGWYESRGYREIGGRYDELEKLI